MNSCAGQLNAANIPKYERRPINRDRLRAIYDHAAGRRVLDVGCGNGNYVLALARDYDIFGCDHRPYDSWKAAPGRFWVSDAHSPAAHLSMFDTILAFEVLEHLQDPKRAVRSWADITRRKVIVTVPNCDISRGMRRSNLTYFHYTDRTHRNFFDIETLTVLLESCGLIVEYTALINQLSPFPLAAEIFGLSPSTGQFFWRVLRPFAKVRCFGTCLAVAARRSEIPTDSRV